MYLKQIKDNNSSKVFLKVAIMNVAMTYLYHVRRSANEFINVIAEDFVSALVYIGNVQ